MGDVIVKIKDENVICELGKPVYSSNLRTPNFKCQFNATVIHVGEFNPTDYPSYANDTEARADGLTTNDIYWFSADTDTGIYNTLKRVSPL